MLVASPPNFISQEKTLPAELKAEVWKPKLLEGAVKQEQRQNKNELLDIKNKMALLTDLLEGLDNNFETNF